MARRIKRLSVQTLREASPSLKDRFIHLHFKDGRVLLGKPIRLEGEVWQFEDSFGHALHISPELLYGADYELKA